jgi:hypothetical protein
LSTPGSAAACSSANALPAADFILVQGRFAQIQETFEIETPSATSCRSLQRREGCRRRQPRRGRPRASPGTAPEPGQVPVPKIYLEGRKD